MPACSYHIIKHRHIYELVTAIQFCVTTPSARAHGKEGYVSWVCVSVCVSNLTSGASVRPEITVTYSAGNEGQKICGFFSETAPFKSYGVICLPVTPYEGTAATFRALFRQHGLLRVLKRLNNRLNTTWNTTGCKAASFFIFSLRPSSKLFRILSVARAYAEGSALSAFISGCCRNIVNISMKLMCFFLYTTVKPESATRC